VYLAMFVAGGLLPGAVEVGSAGMRLAGRLISWARDSLRFFWGLRECGRVIAVYGGLGVGGGWWEG